MEQLADIIGSIIIYILLFSWIKGTIRKRRDKQTPKGNNAQKTIEWEFNSTTGKWEPKDKSKILTESQDGYKEQHELSNQPHQEVYTLNEKADAKQEVQEEIKYNGSVAYPMDEFAHVYQRRYLFSKNELYEYKLLKKIADIKGYIICPKVRLLDLVEPRRGVEKYKTYFYKVQAKHVDFVVCDPNMHIKAIIELDDSSHDRADRKERDTFVDTVLRSVGYTVIHTRHITNDILDTV